MINFKKTAVAILSFVIIFSFCQTTKAMGEEDRCLETTTPLINPECGFYKAISCYMIAGNETPLISEEKIIENNSKYGLFHLRVGLEDFSSRAGGKDRPIDAKSLNALAETFKLLRKYKTGCIVRFSYNLEGIQENGRYIEAEPVLNMILNHVRALSLVISKFTDVVIGVESGMFGPWGEQHSTAISSSDKNNAKAYYALINTWLENLSETIGVTARKPLYLIYFINKKYNLNIDINGLKNFDPYKYPLLKRVGVYNDGYLGSYNDYGTFSNRESECEFIGKLAKTTFYGGEVIADINNGGIGAYNSVNHLEKEGFITHTSYLNYGWNYDKVISVWEKNQYKGKDTLYNGKTNEFNYVLNRLGYHFTVTDAHVSVNEKRQDMINLSVSVRNSGFAPIIRKPVCEVIFANGKTVKTSPCNMDFTLVGSNSDYIFNSVAKVPENMGENDFSLILKLTAQSGKPIKFANEQSTFSDEHNGFILGNLHLTNNNFANDSFLVTFDVNGGTVESGLTSQIVNKGSDAVAPAVSRKGYKFAGWSGSVKNITKDTSVYAIWQEDNGNDTTNDGSDLTEEDGKKHSGCSSNSNIALPHIGFFAFLSFGIVLIKKYIK